MSLIWEQNVEELLIDAEMPHEYQRNILQVSCKVPNSNNNNPLNKWKVLFTYLKITQITCWKKIAKSEKYWTIN